VSVHLKVSIAEQKMILMENSNTLKTYSVSTALKGMGENYGSEQTPTGWHIIRAKIGNNMPINAVFVARRPTGEIYSPELAQKFEKRDWILTRILWLSGLELYKNRLGSVDTMRRYIYIHGTPDETLMGLPGSRGCIRMRNHDIIELFDAIPVGAKIIIQPHF
jgi:L,D-transpeptidase YbiS